jgi:Domain of unknown function (DUF1707)
VRASADFSEPGPTRAGDADRERAVASLRHHYLRGRIDADELARRVERVVTARTRADLRFALQGLPRLGEIVERAGATARIAGYVAGFAAVWAAASLFLLATLVVLALAGLGGAELLVVPLTWLPLSCFLAVTGRRRVRRVRALHR